MKSIIAIIAAIVVSSSAILAQTLTSKGRVTDIDGTPMSGVNVSFKAKSGDIGTTTDGEGFFTIAGLPGKGGVLSFKKEGYTFYKQKVSTSALIYITLSVDDKSVNAVQETGYGSTSKASNTASSTGVSAKDMKGEVRGSNSMKGILGRLSGLGPDMKLRGSNNYPLFVINGVSSSKEMAESLNAEDIERVELLKDAASTAVYGSRGGDGVILIRTKGYGTKAKKQVEKPMKDKK